MAGGAAGTGASQALQVASASIGLVPAYRSADFRRAGAAGAEAFVSAFDPVRLGTQTANAFTDSLSKALSGNALDLSSVFASGNDIFGPMMKSLETVVGKMPLLGGEMQKLYQSVSMVGLASEKWLSTISQIGDKWQDISRVIAGQTFDTGAIDGLTDSVRNLFASDAIIRENDIIRGIGEIHTRLGLAGKALEEFTGIYSMANELLGTTLDLDNVTGVMNAFDVSAEAAATTLTQLINIARDSGVDSNSLFEQIKNLGPSFDQLGYSATQMAQIFAEFSRYNVPIDRLSFTFAQVIGKVEALVEKGKFSNLEEGFNTVISSARELMAIGDNSGARDLLDKWFGDKGGGVLLEGLKNGIMMTAAEMRSLANEGVDPKFNQGLERGIEQTKSFTQNLGVIQRNLEAAFQPVGTAFNEVLGAMTGDLTLWLQTNQGDVVKWAFDVTAAAADVFSMAMDGFSNVLNAMKTPFEIVKDIFASVSEYMLKAIALVNDFRGDSSGAASARELAGQFQGLKDIDLTDVLGKVAQGLQSGSVTAGEIGSELRNKADAAAYPDRVSDAQKFIDSKTGNVEDALGATTDNRLQWMIQDAEARRQIVDRLAEQGVTVITNAAGVITSLKVTNEEQARTFQKLFENLSSGYALATPVYTPDGKAVTPEKPSVPATTERIPLDEGKFSGSSVAVPGRFAPSAYMPKMDANQWFPQNIRPDNWELDSGTIVVPAGLAIDKSSTQSESPTDLMTAMGVPSTFQGSERLTTPVDFKIDTTATTDKTPSVLMDALGIPMEFQGTSKLEAPTELKVDDTEEKSPQEVMEGMGIPISWQGQDGVVIPASYQMTGGMGLPGFGGGSGVPTQGVPYVPGGIAGLPAQEDTHGATKEQVHIMAGLAELAGLRWSSGQSDHDQDGGHHPAGQAGDFSNDTGGWSRSFADNTPQMLNFAKMMSSNFGQYISELIYYDPAFNGNIKDGKLAPIGQVYDQDTLWGHTDHVHLAVSDDRAAAFKAAVQQAITSGTVSGADAAILSAAFNSGSAGSPANSIAAYIAQKAQAAGYSPAETQAFVAQAIGESGLDPNAFGATTGDSTGGASGIFQFTPGTWATFGGGGDPLNARDNIDAYFRLAAFRDPGQGDMRARLARISVGGPAVPANGAPWDQYMQQARELLGSAPVVSSPTSPVVFSTPLAPPPSSDDRARLPMGGRSQTRGISQAEIDALTANTLVPAPITDQLTAVEPAEEESWTARLGKAMGESVSNWTSGSYWLNKLGIDTSTDKWQEKSYNIWGISDIGKAIDQIHSFVTGKPQSPDAGLLSNEDLTNLLQMPDGYEYAQTLRDPNVPWATKVIEGLPILGALLPGAFVAGRGLVGRGGKAVGELPPGTGSSSPSGPFTAPSPADMNATAMIPRQQGALPPGAEGVPPPADILPPSMDAPSQLALPPAPPAAPVARVPLTQTSKAAGRYGFSDGNKTYFVEKEGNKWVVVAEDGTPLGQQMGIGPQKSMTAAREALQTHLDDLAGIEARNSAAAADAWRNQFIKPPPDPNWNFFEPPAGLPATIDGTPPPWENIDTSLGRGPTVGDQMRDRILNPDGSPAGSGGGMPGSSMNDLGFADDVIRDPIWQKLRGNPMFSYYIDWVKEALRLGRPWSEVKQKLSTIAENKWGPDGLSAAKDVAGTAARGAGAVAGVAGIAGIGVFGSVASGENAFTGEDGLFGPGGPFDFRWPTMSDEDPNKSWGFVPAPEKPEVGLDQTKPLTIPLEVPTAPMQPTQPFVPPPPTAELKPSQQPRSDIPKPPALLPLPQAPLPLPPSMGGSAPAAPPPSLPVPGAAAPVPAVPPAAPAAPAPPPSVPPPASILPPAAAAPAPASVPAPVWKWKEAQGGWGYMTDPSSGDTWWVPPGVTRPTLGSDSSTAITSVPGGYEFRPSPSSNGGSVWVLSKKDATGTAAPPAAAPAAPAVPTPNQVLAAEAPPVPTPGSGYVAPNPPSVTPQFSGAQPAAIPDPNNPGFYMMAPGQYGPDNPPPWAGTRRQINEYFMQMQEYTNNMAQIDQRKVERDTELARMQNELLTQTKVQLDRLTPGYLEFRRKVDGSSDPEGMAKSLDPEGSLQREYVGALNAYNNAVKAITNKETSNALADVRDSAEKLKPPPKPPGEDEFAKVSPDGIAKSFGKGFIQGIMQEFGLDNSVFESPLNWAMTRLFTGTLNAGMGLLNWKARQWQDPMQQIIYPDGTPATGGGAPFGPGSSPLLGALYGVIGGITDIRPPTAKFPIPQPASSVTMQGAASVQSQAPDTVQSSLMAPAMPQVTINGYADMGQFTQNVAPGLAAEGLRNSAPATAAVTAPPSPAMPSG